MFRQTALTEETLAVPAVAPHGAVREATIRPAADVDIEAVLRRARALRALHTARLLGVLWTAVKRTVVEPVQAFRRRQETYAELMSLDDHVLRDIGITRGDIVRVSQGAVNNNEPRRAA